MWRIAAILAAIAAFVYVAVVGVQWLQPRVEDDILDRVNTALAGQGQLWADVDVDGRRVVLTGAAPDEESRQKAVQLASRVFGVAGVSDATVVAEPVADAPAKAAPYQLTIEKTNESIIVRGQVASEQDAEVIRRLVKTHYEGMQIEDALEVADNAPAGWRSAVGVMLMNMTNLETAHVTLSGTEVMLDGEVLAQDFSDKLQRDISATLPKDYKVAFAVDVVSPTQVTEETAEAVSPSDAVTTTEEVTATEAKTEDKVAATQPVTETKAVTETQSEKTAAAVEPAAGPASATVAATLSAIAADCTGMSAVTQQVVLFDFDKAALKAEYKPVMKDIAGALKGCADQRLTVAGYTDKSGSPLYNQWLSEQRAESGVRALLREGIARDRLTAVGYGEKDPVAGNDTREGRMKNRRVEFKTGEATAAGVTQIEVISDTAVAPSETSQTGWWNNIMSFGKGEASPSAVSETSVTVPAETSPTK